MAAAESAATGGSASSSTADATALAGADGASSSEATSVPARRLLTIADVSVFRIGTTQADQSTNPTPHSAPAPPAVVAVPTAAVYTATVAPPAVPAAGTPMVAATQEAAADDTDANTAGAGAAGAGAPSLVRRTLVASGVMHVCTVGGVPTPTGAVSADGTAQLSAALTFATIGDSFALPLVAKPALRAGPRTFLLPAADDDTTWGLTVSPTVPDNDARALQVLLATQCRLYDRASRTLIDPARVAAGEDGTAESAAAGKADATKVAAGAGPGMGTSDGETPPSAADAVATGAATGDAAAGSDPTVTDVDAASSLKSGAKDVKNTAAAPAAGADSGDGADATNAAGDGDDSGAAAAADGAAAAADPATVAGYLSYGLEVSGQAIATGATVGAEWVGYGVRRGSDWLTSYLAPASEDDAATVSDSTKSALETAGAVSAAAVTVTTALVEALTYAAGRVGSAVLSVASTSTVGAALAEGASSETGQAVGKVAASGLVALSTALDGLESAAITLVREATDSTAHVVEHSLGKEAGEVARQSAAVGQDVVRAGLNIRRMGTASLVRRNLAGAARDSVAAQGGGDSGAAAGAGAAASDVDGAAAEPPAPVAPRASTPAPASESSVAAIRARLASQGLTDAGNLHIGAGDK